ncbi:hypothetical protein P171DRAFT_486625 [Karstenula rhodostoma CBS 690.94]|uniref:Uncharacterized protein n=1 Tax=Karstenula rhodostoma CBS 690.94 TaxID=1392251 RepID=A0A9P4PEP4_9PLEO|nr:hypothetical protein P171DRAFT_486625 [Karstenula rhodostoma CBS 690.94]
MAFFKQFLPTFDEPPDPRGPPPRNQPNIQLASNSDRGPRVTLSQLRLALYDPGDNPFSPGAQDPAASLFRAPEFDISPNASTVEEILHATKDFLDGEILAEQERMRAKPEFLFEKVIPHAKGNDLPQFSTAEELRNANNGSDLTIPVRDLGMTVDKDMMERIRAGQGPRPFKAEDLVERLRLEPKKIPGTDNAPYTDETYNELLAVLRAWNARVGTYPDLDVERQDLLDTFESRCQLIDGVEKGYQNERLLEEQCLRMREALHAYRPELENFEDQNVFSQLIVMIANQGIAIPDLDDNIRDRAIETLFREFRSRIYLGEEHSARRDRINSESERAKLQEDDTEVLDLAEERKQLDKESCNEASEKVRTAIKIARKRLCDKVLEELQPLTEQQAGQRWTAYSLAKASTSVLAQSCIESKNAMDEVLQTRVLDIDNALKSAIDHLRKMNRLSSHNNSLVMKLAGLDVPKAERKATMERRRNDRRTPYIMMEVANQSSQLPGMSQCVLMQMDDMDGSLHCVLDAVRANFNAHDTLLARVDEDDPYFMAETSYVVKKHQATVNGGRGQVVEAESAMGDVETAPGER